MPSLFENTDELWSFVLWHERLPPKAAGQGGNDCHTTELCSSSVLSNRDGIK
jgi:hypothetical protein